MNEPLAVLFSGGLDSGVLLAIAAARGDVQPIYVRAGLAWEPAELAVAARFFRHFGDRVRPLVALGVDMRDVYPASHWAVRGEAPGFDTPDEDVYIDGRNIVLLSKASVFMARAGLTRVWMGTLAGNPFPDASRAFFDAMEVALSTGLNAPIAIEAPLAAMHKEDVIRRGAELGVPFELTLSCMQPVDAQHCGRCSKCRERRDGFAAAGIADPTAYAVAPVR
ncbi:MAG TPA: 7-cyano-7-deazaguanine synthase [Vicinamibacterales bacterium]